MAIALFVSVVAKQPAASQYARLDLGGFIETGGEAERYLRVLQDAGIVRFTPWSVQPFAPTQARELRAKTEHPWQTRFDAANGASNTADGVRLLRPQGRLIENSTFPFQDGSGPIWAGRGLTGEIQLGALASWNFFSAQLAPLAFATQNLAFPLAPNGQTGALKFADPRFPKNIDAPQRFGDHAYERADPGSSSLFLDNFGLVAGATTAPQRWGPAIDYPLVLSPNPGGFPTAFVGTSTPLDLWLFRLHTRLVYSRLAQSSFSPFDSADAVRLGAGVVGTIEPRGIPGLELGGARFIHNLWPERGVTVDELLRPFSATNVLGSANNIQTENQVASVFARWVLAPARTEFYGEMYREDFPGRFHSSLSLVEKPDDLAAFTLGFQHVWFGDGPRIRAIHGEIVNSQVSHQERETRGFTIPLPPYIHTFETQGHTVDGLIIGSPEAYGGAAWRLGVDDYTPVGRTSISLERSMRFDWLPTLPTPDSTLVHPDVIYSIRVDALRFYGNDELGLTVIPAIDLNRNLVAGRNVFNIAIGITYRRWF